MAFALATAVSLASGGSLVPAVKGFPQDDGLDCGIEPMHHYASEWNDTALTLCRGDPRPEQVCIVGGGMSGVHMGWLLKRRGFEKTVVLEANDRLGGKVYTLTGGVGGGDVTREMGAAFLSPDYVEVRALVARFGQSEVPISVGLSSASAPSAASPPPGGPGHGEEPKCSPAALRCRPPPPPPISPHGCKVKHMMRFHWNGTVGYDCCVIHQFCPASRLPRPIAPRACCGVCPS